MRIAMEALRKTACPERMRRPGRRVPTASFASSLLLAVLLLAASVFSQDVSQPPGSPRVITVEMNHVVHPVSAEILRNAIAEAEESGASAVLIRLNTPGGLMEAMRECVEAIVSSKTPVITYVTPGGARAASAGFFLLQAGDVAAMAPGTSTGAASPVLMGQEMDAVMRKKVEQDASASLRSLAGRRGRNAALAESTVLEAKAFTEEEALREKLIDLVANSEEDLLRKLEGHSYTAWDGERRTLRLGDASLVAYEPSIRERIMAAISNPNIAFVLTVLGALGIYVEFTHPGLIVPGVAGAISLLLGLSALSILPINWMGAALLVLALALFVMEASMPTHGILGTGGVIAMALGAMLLIDSPAPEMRIATSVAIAASVGFGAITVFLLSLVVRATRNKVATGLETLPGKTAIAMEDLNPSGRVRLDGDFWNAVSSGPVAKGAPVRVLTIRGLTLEVEPATPNPEPHSGPHGKETEP